MLEGFSELGAALVAREATGELNVGAVGTATVEQAAESAEALGLIGAEGLERFGGREEGESWLDLANLSELDEDVFVEGMRRLVGKASLEERGSTSSHLPHSTERLTWVGSSTAFRATPASWVSCAADCSRPELCRNCSTSWITCDASTSACPLSMHAPQRLRTCPASGCLHWHRFPHC